MALLSSNFGHNGGWITALLGVQDIKSVNELKRVTVSSTYWLINMFLIVNQQNSLLLCKFKIKG